MSMSRTTTLHCRCSFRYRRKSGRARSYIVPTESDPLPTLGKSARVAFCGRGPMKAREATLADKAAIIELWKRCALTRPWNDPSRDFDFAHSGPASAVIVLESDGVIVGAALVGHDGHR